MDQRSALLFMRLLQFDHGGDLILRSQDGKPIRSVEDWFRFAPPKRGAEQWRDGRSAKELARAWFRCPEASPPAELNRLLRIDAAASRIHSKLG